MVGSGDIKLQRLGGPLEGYNPARVRIPDIKLVKFFILEDELEAAKLLWAGRARSARFCVLISSTRGVHAALGRARVAKTH